MFRHSGHHRHAGPGFRFRAPRGHGFGRFHHGWGEGPWPGRGFGPFGRGFGGFGPPRGQRRFGRGDLKYVILDLLADKPRHGYDVIRALEERFHGFYSPSPGSVYPTLQLLEDQGYVSSNEQDGKKVYSITEEGRRFLRERADVVEGIQARANTGWGPKITPEMVQLAQEVRQIGQFVFRQGAHGALNDPDKVRRLRDVVARARTEIEAIFSDEPASPTTLV